MRPPDHHHPSRRFITLGPSPYHPRPSSSLSSSSDTSYRVRFVVVVLALLVVGFVVREKEAAIKAEFRQQHVHEQQPPQEGASFNKALEDGLRAIKTKLVEAANGEDEEESELFSVLQSEFDQELSARDVVQMMEEGAIELPHVDHEEEEESLGADGATTATASDEEELLMAKQLMHEKDEVNLPEMVTPTAEEISSGQVKIIPNLGVNSDLDDLHPDEQTKEEFEEPVRNKDDDDDGSVPDDDASAAASPPSDTSSTTRPNLLLPQVRYAKEPKAFKMINTHFLALVDAFTHAGWTRLSEHAYTSSASLLLTKPVTVVPGSRGKMISQISSSSCLGGTKGSQLSCRSKFALAAGCTFDEDLKISPRQFDMWRSADCERFFDVALRPSNQNKQWIGKLGASYHGKHITIFTGVPKSVKTHFGKCKLNKETGGGYIIQEYVSDPALIEGRKFDVRTFLLIGSTEPFLVFYHRGFVRRSATAYSSTLTDKLAHITNLESQDSDDHFWGFNTLEKALTAELGFAPDYMRTTFAARTKLVTNYVFQAAKAKLKRRAGAYMLFGLDWMIDRKGGVHLLEGNGSPMIRHYPQTDDLTPKMWREMASLLTTIHFEPDKLQGRPFVRESFHFGGWELVYSEIEEKEFGMVYNPCTDVMKS